MSRLRRAALAAGALCAGLVLSGCTVAVAGAPSPTTSTTERVRLAPYVDVNIARPDMVQVANDTGVNQFTLAFALASPAGCAPAWGGSLPIDDPGLLAEVAALRKAGGDIAVATGGALGTYLETVCSSPDELADAYATLLDTYGTNRLDVDIEAPVEADRVIAALLSLQRARGTAIRLTLPIDLAGLPPSALDLVQRAATAKLDLTVNGMDMNFRTGGDWGQAMLDAAQATLDQLRAVYPDGSEAVQNRTLGLTIMIGRNDAGPLTTEADLRKVVEFARSRGLGFLGIWSLARDNGDCPGKKKAQPTCSGVEQSPFAFTRLLGDAG